MTSRINVILLTLVILFTVSALFGDSDHNLNPADSVSVEIFASSILMQFYDENPNVADWILWDSLTVNGKDFGSDYQNAKDYNEEDTFMKDILKAIHDDLHYDGEQNYSYSNWNVTYGDGYITVTANNEKKKVIMDFQTNDTNSMFLHSIAVEDR